MAETLKVAKRRIWVRAWLTAVVILFIFGAIDVILWLGATDVASGNMSSGELTAFVFYAIVVAGSVGALSEMWGDLQRAAGATERLMELLNMRPGIAVPEIAGVLPDPAGSVDFQDVRFRYPARPEVAALDGFSMAVRPGEKVALVGPSGAGKSTVFQLLLRFYDIESGAVLVDGADISDADPVAVRERYGLVAQDPVMFAATAMENIRYGRPEASDDEVRTLLRLPVQRSSSTGCRRDTAPNWAKRDSACLVDSGNVLRSHAHCCAIRRSCCWTRQRQRWMPESERAVQQALEKLMQDRTTLIIAHRLATVLKADRIIVMDQGQVVASGSHTELMEQGGLYARLARLQFDTSHEALEGNTSADAAE